VVLVKKPPGKFYLFNSFKMSRTVFPQQAWATKLTANDSSAKEELGIVRFEIDRTGGLKGYRYVQTADDTTVANGTCLRYSDTLRHTTSSDFDDAGINQVHGVGIGAITAEYFGWIQCYGYHATVLTDGGDDISDGDWVILDADGDGVCDSTASGTPAVSKPLGVAVADDINDADTVAVQLDCVF